MHSAALVWRVGPGRRQTPIAPKRAITWQRQSDERPGTQIMVIDRLSVLVSDFRMVSVVSIQRQWWFQDVSGCFRMFQDISESVVDGHARGTVAMGESVI
jgi:hypothetical protein